jgi:hypothetical protein
MKNWSKKSQKSGAHWQQGTPTEMMLRGGHLIHFSDKMKVSYQGNKMEGGQGCHASGRPRPRSTTPQTSTLAAIHQADGEAIGHPSAAATGKRRGQPPSDRRKGWPSSGRQGRPPRPSDGGGRLSRPPEAVRNRRPTEAIHLRRPLSMTEISHF